MTKMKKATAANYHNRRLLMFIFVCHHSLQVMLTMYAILANSSLLVNQYPLGQTITISGYCNTTIETPLVD